MHFINKRFTMTGAGVLLSIFLSGCGMMDHTIDKQINKVKGDKKTEKTKEAASANKPESEVNEKDITLSQSQKNRLKGAESQTPEEAISKSKKKAKEVGINLPQNKEEFTDVNEFSQYISHLLFLYHSGEIKGDQFYTVGKKYMSESFLAQLPDTDAERKNTFIELVKLFKEQLRSDIKSYQLTDVELDERAKEASFYRKYTLKNGERVYYQTVMKKENEKWLLLDDSPSESYKAENTNKKFHSPKGD
ncbi:hypothetical protein [Rummeliibacillus stabekisii]|uniref:hypothetical protein n=1 Tax=Rummeliibacillus stabekisii TaxID=241244 RepID=UPI00117587F1|nr:hypothetical protein [Rummeliibacillus stabekisii]MBB5171573.1 hypothetical protein [Rummeliibacillus stabekisii]GEL05541.1 hypothetical protein RST01_21680 [Rummeliibacillus stabekisii]